MDFDSAYIDPFLDEWLSCLQEKSRQQEKFILEKSKFFIPNIELNDSDVRLIFNIIEQFKCHSNAKYLAVHLFEKYVNFKMKQNLDLNPNYIINKSEMKLRLLSCIQLASKMDSNEDYLKISHIKRILKEMDPDRIYPNKVILDSEFYVFKSVEFEIPTYTTKNCVDVLLAASGLRNTLEIVKSASKLLDLSYHEELHSNLKTITHEGSRTEFFDDRNNLLLKSNALVLGASIIFSSVFFMNMEKGNLKELLKKVAVLVELKETDIWDMSNSLLSLSYQE
ncbi:cyclin N-terminal domain-containing protein 1-like isoform X2 [Leptopilina heterotoma]|uniref:cyclin N-terminal domain-containing protein 1-like isoform X2 n=1 Tax=Leptopilina heterotoma TaxID=63436 RepID=UPI001CA8C42D|nr:cyclin N-terminal domain-containing protein 1-like isoform X2 [Leptopilina heterotoma]